MFENEEFTTRTKKDHGIAIHPSLLSAADDEKKSGEVRDVNFLHLSMQFLNTFFLQLSSQIWLISVHNEPFGRLQHCTKSIHEKNGGCECRIIC